MLGAQQISLVDSEYDSIILYLGNNPHFFIKNCYQYINIDNSISDISNFDDLTIDDCVEYLNLLKIKLPFDVDLASKIMSYKLYSQRISAKSILSEDV